jgi:decaprenylphospho-beta-D-ribofuranose 2-oxidase
MMLSGWGRFPCLECRVSRSRTEVDLRARIAEGNLIARGNGRAYGDSALSTKNTLDMRCFNRMLSFDPETGQLVAEAGVLLGDVIATFLPRGWFPPVTPGTKFVTVGGMIAADVHGKNHHKNGTFGRFVDWIELADAVAEVRTPISLPGRWGVWGSRALFCAPHSACSP